MASFSHIQARWEGDADTSGISSTAIALIVCIGIVPVVALIWAVVWLIFFYGSDRTCCCTKRKKRETTPEMLEQGGSTDASQETQYGKGVHDLPQRPWTATRSGPGTSGGGNRLTKPDPNRPFTTVARLETNSSAHSVASNSTTPAMQEPRRFV